MADASLTVNGPITGQPNDPNLTKNSGLPTQHELLQESGASFGGVAPNDPLLINTMVHRNGVDAAAVNPQSAFAIQISPIDMTTEDVDLVDMYDLTTDVFTNKRAGGPAIELFAGPQFIPEVNPIDITAGVGLKVTTSADIARDNLRLFASLFFLVEKIVQGGVVGFVSRIAKNFSVTTDANGEVKFSAGFSISVPSQKRMKMGIILSTRTGFGIFNVTDKVIVLGDTAQTFADYLLMKPSQLTF